MLLLRLLIRVHAIQLSLCSPSAATSASTTSVPSIVTIDWTMRENVRAQLRVIIKRILRKYGYPPDKQEKATQTFLEQVELLGWEVAA